MARIRSCASWGVAATLTLGLATSAGASTGDEGESHVYSGPAEVTQSLTEREALATLTSPPVTLVPQIRDLSRQVTPRCIACVSHSPAVTQVVSGPVLIQRRFVKYLTSAWAYSTGYTWSSTTTVTATVSADIGVSASGIAGKIGVSASRSQSYTVAVSIYSDRTRLSKLGLYSDYNRYYVRHRPSYITGTTPPAYKYAYLYSPRVDQYLITTYQ
jgi:hypothetical protein